MVQPPTSHFFPPGDLRFAIGQRAGPAYGQPSHARLRKTVAGTRRGQCWAWQSWQCVMAALEHDFDKKTPPKTNEFVPFLKGLLKNGKYIFQPLIFRGNMLVFREVLLGYPRDLSKRFWKNTCIWCNVAFGWFYWMKARNMWLPDMTR